MAVIKFIMLMNMAIYFYHSSTKSYQILLQYYKTWSTPTIINEDIATTRGMTFTTTYTNATMWPL